MKRLYSSGTVSAIDPSGAVDVLRQITDMLQGVQGDLSQVIIEYNKEVFPTIGTLPQGKAETRWRLPDDNINPRINNLDGANIFVDTNASSTLNGGRFWYSTVNTNRPKTIKESVLDLYTAINAAIDQLRAEIAAIAANAPLVAYNTSLTIGNIVEDDVRSIIFDGVNVIASDAGDGVISVASNALANPTTTRGDIIYNDGTLVLARLPVGTSSQFLTTDGTDISWSTSSSIVDSSIVVGNSLEGDTTSNCHYLDIGDGEQLKEAIEVGAAATLPGTKAKDVYIRPGVYNLGFGVSAGTGLITIPADVTVRGSGIGTTRIVANTSSFATAEHVNPFDLGDRSALLDLNIYCPLLEDAGYTNSSGAGTVMCSGEGGLVQNVLIEYENYWLTVTSSWTEYIKFAFGTPDLTSPGSEPNRFINCTVLKCPDIVTYSSFVCFQHKATAHCIVENLYGQGGSTGIDSDQAVSIINCTLEENEASGYNYYNGIYAHGGSRCVVTGNRITGRFDSAAGIYSDMDYSVISNNVITASAPGVSEYLIEHRGDNSTITGNVGEGFLAGIRLYNADDNLVVGNYCCGYSILEEGSSAGNDTAHNK